MYSILGVNAQYSILYTDCILYNVFYTGGKRSIQYTVRIQVVYCIMYSILGVNAQYSILYTDCMLNNVFYVLGVNAQYIILYRDCILYNVFYTGSKRSIQYIV